MTQLQDYGSMPRQKAISITQRISIPDTVDSWFASFVLRGFFFSSLLSLTDIRREEVLLLNNPCDEVLHFTPQ